MVKLSLAQQKRKFIWVSWETHFFQYTKKAVCTKLVYLLFAFFIETENVFFFPCLWKEQKSEKPQVKFKTQIWEVWISIKGNKTAFPHLSWICFYFYPSKKVWSISAMYHNSQILPQSAGEKRNSFYKMALWDQFYKYL